MRVLLELSKNLLFCIINNRDRKPNGQKSWLEGELRNLQETGRWGWSEGHWESFLLFIERTHSFSKSLKPCTSRTSTTEARDLPKATGEQKGRG
jgi:hypothetical protein